MCFAVAFLWLHDQQLAVRGGRSSDLYSAVASSPIPCGLCLPRIASRYPPQFCSREEDQRQGGIYFGQAPGNAIWRWSAKQRASKRRQACFLLMPSLTWDSDSQRGGGREGEHHFAAPPLPIPLPQASATFFPEPVTLLRYYSA
ncbi:hypothetical protein J1614_004043 [Plenodomus biglobosus]|nr:hypothetical protein J1614_004043 [Plenodomus biglobosus]